MSLQFGDGEESDNASETWVLQSTLGMEDSFYETKEECEHKCVIKYGST